MSTETFEQAVRRTKSAAFGRRNEEATLATCRFLHRNDERARQKDTWDRQIADWIKSSKGFIVLMGAPGVGKTFFCSAIMDYVLFTKKNLSCIRAFNENQLLSKVRDSIENTKGDYQRILTELIDHEFLIVDDVGSAGMNDWRREIIFELIDQRYKSNQATLFTTNFDREAMKDEIKGLGPRSASRLLGNENLIIDLHDAFDWRQIPVEQRGNV